MGGRVANFRDDPRRVHVLEGYRWGQAAGTDYWLNINSGFDIFAAAATTVGEQLAENGWTATSLVNTAGSGSDFGGGAQTAVVTPYGTIQVGADVGIPNHVLTDASGDLLASPAIFGNYTHMNQARRLLGRQTLPRFLICEVMAAFTVASANEVTSAIGFFEDGATVSVEADQYAVIISDGTNFKLTANAATLATGPVIDTAWHTWQIVLDYQGAAGPNIYAYVDGAIFSATAGVGIQDEFPLKFGLHTLTTNRLGLAMAHVYYSW